MSQEPTPTAAEAATELGVSAQAISQWLSRHPDIPRRRRGEPKGWRDKRAPKTRYTEYLRVIEDFQKHCEARGEPMKPMLMRLMKMEMSRGRTLQKQVPHRTRKRASVERSHV